jgi:FkbM family methyltransferase
MNYEGVTGLFFENVGIGSEVGIQPFYHFSESSSSWHNELGSFKKEVLYNHNIANVDEMIITVEVPVLTISSLLKKHGLKNIDIITIDTEGYDFEILKTIDFKAFNPSVILYEHRHLSQTDYKQSLKLLSQNNYSLYSEYGSDTIAVLND